VDRLRVWLVLLLPLAAAACGGSARPKQLLNGDIAATFAPVEGSVVAAARALRRATLGSRLDACLLPGKEHVDGDSLVVERVGVDNESLTFSSPDGAGVYACDGGVDPAGERTLPWCGLVFGERAEGRLLDPRLDVNCRGPDGEPLAYAFVEPVERAHWIGVRRDGYVELHEVLAGLPVRIAKSDGISREHARARFEVEQFDVAGRLLVRGVLEPAVAG
jgi:hypothetical protein